MEQSEYDVMYQSLLQMVLDAGEKLICNKFVTEKMAAKMLGYKGADTLRKRVYAHTNNLPYIVIGNRRSYDFDAIVRVLTTKKY